MRIHGSRTHFTKTLNSGLLGLTLLGAMAAGCSSTAATVQQKAAAQPLGSVRLEEVADWEFEAREDKLQPDLKVSSTAADSPEAVRAYLASHEGLPVVLVFSDPQVRLSELRRFVSPLLATHPTIHVYTGEPQ